jgi:hypothetical protein
MIKILRNILALVIGAALGMALNRWLIGISNSLIPLPEGVNPSNLKSIQTHIHLYSLKHFVMPFWAHALGTFVSAFVAAKIWIGDPMIPGYIFGLFFLIGGITMVYFIKSPILPSMVDLLFAYLPMGWLGARLAGANPLKSTIQP